MNKFLKCIVLFLTSVIITATFAQGCAILAQPVAGKVASAVEKYCEEPYSYRQIYRNTVNSQLIVSGHTVHVHCAGDPTQE